MKDFVGLDGILSRERLAELSVRRDGPALLYLSSHWGAIAASTWALSLTWSTWWCVPFFLLQGGTAELLVCPDA